MFDSLGEYDRKHKTNKQKLQAEYLSEQIAERKVLREKQLERERELDRLDQERELRWKYEQERLGSGVDTWEQAQHSQPTKPPQPPQPPPRQAHQQGVTATSNLHNSLVAANTVAQPSLALAPPLLSARAPFYGHNLSTNNHQCLPVQGLSSAHNWSPQAPSAKHWSPVAPHSRRVPWPPDEELRSAISLRLENELVQLKRSCSLQREELRLQSDSFRAQAARLLAEESRLPRLPLSARAPTLAPLLPSVTERSRELALLAQAVVSEVGPAKVSNLRSAWSPRVPLLPLTSQSQIRYLEELNEGPRSLRESSTLVAVAGPFSNRGVHIVGQRRGGKGYEESTSLSKTLEASKCFQPDALVDLDSLQYSRTPSDLEATMEPLSSDSDGNRLMGRVVNLGCALREEASVSLRPAKGKVRQVGADDVDMLVSALSSQQRNLLPPLPPPRRQHKDEDSATHNSDPIEDRVRVEQEPAEDSVAQPSKPQRAGPQAIQQPDDSSATLESTPFGLAAKLSREAEAAPS